MQWWQTALAAVAIGVPALLAIVIGVTAMRITRLRWQRVQPRRIDRDAMPAEARALLDGQRERLERLGFSWAYSETNERMVAVPGGTAQYTDVWRRGSTFALVSRADQPEPGRPCTVHWLTCLADGRSRITFNVFIHFVVGRVDGWLFDDDYLPSDEQALARHEERVRADGVPAIDDAHEVFRRLAALPASLIDRMQRDGRLSPGDAPHLRLGPAVAMAWSIYRGQWRTGAARGVGGAVPAVAASASASISAPAPAPADDADLQAFAHQQALAAARPWSRAGKWKAFTISALLFVAVGSLFSSWRFAAILLLVIALHEGGHYLAMRWTGHRNLSVFFLPGLGGLAIGEKVDASPLEKTFVFLAGPVPGLLLAAFGLVAMAPGRFDAPSWFVEFLIACLIVNYLNLLPLVPLDGGRVVEALLFARVPLLRFGFGLLGFAVLAGAALAMGDTVLLVLAVFIAIGLRHQWRVARVARALPRAAGETLDEPAALARIFESLRAAPFARWPFAVRAAVARSLLPELRGRLPTPGESVLGLGAYAACLAAPLVIALWAAPQWVEAARLIAGVHGAFTPDDVEPDPAASASLVPPEPLADRLARADQMPVAQRVELWLEAAEEPGQHGSLWLDRASQLTAGLDRQDPLRLRVLLARARLAASWEEGRALLQQVIADLDGSTAQPQRLLLAQAHEQLGWGLPEGERLPHLEASVAARRAAAPADDPQLATSRTGLAQALSSLGRAAEAQAQLQANIDAQPLPTTDDRSRAALARRLAHVQAHTEMAWFMIDQGRAAEGRAAAARAADAVPPKVTVSWQHPQRMALEARVWSSLVPPDPPTLAAAWTRYEAATSQAFGGMRSPLVDVDRLLVAEALGDDALARKALEALRKAGVSGRQPILPALCDGASRRGTAALRRTQTEQRRAVVERHRLCPPP